MFSLQNAGAQAALEAADRILGLDRRAGGGGVRTFNEGGERGGATNYFSNNEEEEGAEAGGRTVTKSEMSKGGDGSILKISIDNMLYPITVEILHKVAVYTESSLSGRSLCVCVLIM